MKDTAQPPTGRAADALPREDGDANGEAEILVWNGLVADPERECLVRRRRRLAPSWSQLAVRSEPLRERHWRIAIRHAVPFFHTSRAYRHARQPR